MLPEPGRDQFSGTKNTDLLIVVLSGRQPCNKINQICLTATYSSHSDRRTPKCFGLAAAPLFSFLTVESTRCCLKGKTVKMDCAM